MINSLKNMYIEIRYALAILLIASDALVGGMLYAGVSFKAEEEVVEETGLVFTKLTETLYSLTGSVAAGDCEKIVPELPTQGAFTVILESPGGSLNDGACLASHFKIRDVVTVVRDTPVLNENGEVLYQPDYDGDGKVMCASACSLMFLGGDMRFLVGDVWLGIHAPRTPDGGGISAAALEASAYRTAAALLKLLEDLGVTDEEVRSLFIRVPAASMYFLNPKDFDGMPALVMLATNYIDFHDFTAENPLGSVGG
jgi:predicted lipoprotein with Yx(FWY)xxD motif